MKNITFLMMLLLALLVNSSNAQSEEKNRKIELNFGTKVVQQKVVNPKAGVFSNGLGLSMEFNHLINSKGHLGYKFGLSYSLVQLKHEDYLAAFFDCDRINPGTFTFNTSWIRNDIKIHYFGLPIDLVIKPMKGSNAFYIKLGVEPLLKFHQNTDSYLVMCGAPEMEIQNEEFTKTKSSHLRYRFGLGYDFLVGTKYEMLVEINYEFIDSYFFTNSPILGGFVNNLKVREFGVRLGFRI